MMMRAVKDDIDGIVIGSPGFYDSPNGSLLAFLLDREFYSQGKELL